MALRIIPRLDIKGDKLVKGIQFDGLRVLGRPEEFARLYAEAGADELLYMDVVASLYGRNSLLELVERTARNVCIPLTVGGGIRTVEDIRAALLAGADKVAVNTAAIKNPELINEAARRFGSSTIVVSIEAKRRANGSYEAYVDNGREPTGRNVAEWGREANQRGAGEILLTSVDREGTGNGFDLEAVEEVTRAIRCPLIVGGGAGSVGHIKQVDGRSGVSAVALASLLHYNAIRRGDISGGVALPVGIADVSLLEIRHAMEGGGEIRARDIAPPRRTVCDDSPMVAIIDYGSGNLASVRWACEHAGLLARVTDDPVALSESDAVVLPGVGAFGDSMDALRRLRLIDPLKAFAAGGRLLVGVCLGMQLLFDRSEEFGASEGLRLIPGAVMPLDPASGVVPHIGWGYLQTSDGVPDCLMNGLSEHPSMYFVHSFHVVPTDPRVIMARVHFGAARICAAVQRGNIWGFQFHPERSGGAGLRIWHNLADMLATPAKLRIKSAKVAVR